MIWARRALGPVAAMWLVCQGATLALAPVLLEVSLAECVCTHGAEATCPMHHSNAAGLKVCVMRSATSAPGTLNSLFSVAGLLPSFPPAIVPMPTTARMAREYSTTTQRPSPPDPPPPRA